MILQSTWINAQTNDYQVQNGIYVKKHPLLTEAYTRIVTPYGTYLFDKTFGSYIPLWLNTRDILNANQIIGELIRATQPMVDNNKAISIQANLTAPPTRNAIFFKLSIYDVNAILFELNTNYVAIPA